VVEPGLLEMRVLFSRQPPGANWHLGKAPFRGLTWCKAQPSVRVSINFRQHKSPKSRPGWPNTHQCTSSVLSIVGVQMDESQLQVAQCHLGCSLYFSPFSLLPPIPVTYLPIHLPTPSFTQSFLLPSSSFAKPSLPLWEGACLLQSRKPCEVSSC
jgi:hypothetical protein